jgi:2-keto-4-pentenoate hydratase/2-oxohepta-3-ene-1,7-dioic acid hydratase in catechol pathway
MKLVTFRTDDGPERLGALIDDASVLDLAAAADSAGRSSPALGGMQAFIESGPAALDIARALVDKAPQPALRSLDRVRLLPPLPRPPKLRDFSCFEKHLKQAAEGAARALAAQSVDPEHEYERIREAHGLNRIPSPGWYALPGYYYSDVTTVVGHDVSVTWPAYSRWIDYELELAAVIGTTGKDIERTRALTHIFGYTVFNDLSARDAQLAAMSTGLGTGKGKDFDGSNVLGPCIVTADEIPDPYQLSMVARVNGEEISRGNTSEMHWRFEDCIEYAARSQTLYAGEVFGSGTVGNGSTIELGVTLKRGDVIELEIEKIGVLRTAIR